MFCLQLHYDVTVIVSFALAVGSLAVLAMIATKPRMAPVNRRLDGLTVGNEALPAGVQTPSIRSSPTSAPAAVRRNRKPEKTGGLAERMLHAGLYTPRMRAVFYIMRVVGLLVPIIAGFSLGHAGLLTVRQGMAVGVIAGLAGTLAPGMWLDHLKAVRQTKIRRALPDALDVMSVCLQGGLSLNVALGHVARELSLAHPALAAELNILERQIQMGRTAGDAIREMANRFDLDELRSMSSVIGQAERIGASVASALELFADTMRIKRHQRAEELAHKASVKMLIPTLFFVFPAAFVVILGPAVIRFLTDVLPGFSK